MVFVGCRINELKDKQVISVKDGAVLGFVSDVELDIENGRLTAVIIPGRSRGLGLFGREGDIIIPWEKIEVIGNDSILVNFELLSGVITNQSNHKNNFFGL